MDLKSHYTKKIENFYNDFKSCIEKLDNDKTVKYILDNHSSKLESLDVSIDTINIEIQDLLFCISNYRDEETNLTDEQIQSIEDEKDRKKVIKDCLPIMLSYYMTLLENKKNNNNTENSITNNLNLSNTNSDLENTDLYLDNTDSDLYNTNSELDNSSVFDLD